MNFAIYKFKFGYLKIKYEKNIITGIKKVSYFDGLSKATDLTDYVFNQIEEYLVGKRKYFDFKYELRGTDFQMKVWNELKKIPYGETLSYKDIAIRIGNEKSYRAVGNANNKNPITIVVPCHRVIGENGKLVGYFGGLKMKEFLLNLERNNNGL